MQSSILVLHGYNHHDSTYTLVQSWLSVAALEFVQHVRQSHDTAESLVTHHSCEPHMTAGDAMENIIDQLWEQLPGTTREGIDVMQGSVVVDRDRDRLDECCRWVSGILSKCQQQVYIVLDRPDFCEGGPAETWRFVRGLLGLVVRSEERLRILLVMRTGRWNIEQRLGYLKKSDKERMFVLRLDQEEL